MNEYLEVIMLSNSEYSAAADVPSANYWIFHILIDEVHLSFPSSNIIEIDFIWVLKENPLINAGIKILLVI